VARTPEGEAITKAFQARQVALTATVLRELLRLWNALVKPGDFSTFQQFAEAAAAIVGLRRQDAVNLAMTYYQEFRVAEDVGTLTAPTQTLVFAGASALREMPILGVTRELRSEPGRVIDGSFTPLPALPLDETQVATGLRAASLSSVASARRAGQSYETATKTAFVRTSGTATRLVNDGARDTITRSVKRDDKALGWLRSTDDDPCAFCRMLASRGPVYKTRATAGFQAHDHDRCHPEPFFEGSVVPRLNQQFKREYDAAQTWARVTGNGAKGTKNDALNNLRQYLAQRPDAG
jgi:hypothetical protein